MMTSFSIGTGILHSLYLLFVTATVNVPVSMPPGEADPFLARIAPDECLYYTNWSGAGDTIADSENTIDRLFLEPEIIHFRERLPESIREFGELAYRNRPGGANFRAQFLDLPGRVEPIDVGNHLSSFELGVILTELLMTRPCSIFATQFSPDPMTASGAIVINVGDRQQELAQHIKVFIASGHFDSLETISIAGSPFSQIKISESLTLTWGFHDEYLIAASGRDQITDLIDRSATPPPAWLIALEDEYQLPRRATLTYANLRELFSIAINATNNPQVIDRCRAAGLQHLDSFVCITGLDEKQYVSRTHIKLDEELSGLLNALPSRPLKPEDLKSIPADALIGVALKMEATRFFDQLLEVAFSLNLQAMLGAELRQEIVAALGETFTLYTTKIDGGLLTGWTMTVEVLNEKAIVQALDQLVDTFESSQIEIRTHELEGSRLSTVHIPNFPLAPTWCLEDSQLILGLFPQTVRSHLQRDTTGKSLADRDDVRRLFAGDLDPCLLVYRDTRNILAEGYPSVQLGFQGFQSFLLPADANTYISVLPSAQAITRHMQPAIWFARRDSTGYQVESFQSLPGGSLSAAAPIIAAATIPIIQESSRATLRNRSINNLRQLMLAAHNYESVHSSFPAAYNTDKNGKPLLSWRVHLLPYLGQNDLYQQFRLDEPWDSAHNRKLIAQMPLVYRAPTSEADPGKTNYVAIRSKHSVIVPPKESEFGKRNPRGIRFRDILDGTSNTIAMVEASDESSVIWSKPDDLEPNLENPIQGLIGMHPGLFLAAYADCSVTTFLKNVDPDILRAVFTRDQAEEVSPHRR